MDASYVSIRVFENHRYARMMGVMNAGTDVRYSRDSKSGYAEVEDALWYSQGTSVLLLGTDVGGYPDISRFLRHSLDVWLILDDLQLRVRVVSSEVVSACSS